MSSQKPILLILSQVFIPDPASVGQHMADVATEMARRGHRVVVLASDAGYENPEIRYPRREIIQGVEVRRIRFSSFGKRAIALRVLGTLSFALQCFFRGLVMRPLAGVFFGTTPPMIGAVAAALRTLRRVPVAYWAMDLNPEQLVALGKLSPVAPATRILGKLHEWIVGNAAVSFALDRFMAEGLRRRDRSGNANIVVVPPWPHENHIEPVAHSANPFREQHSLQDKFVVMYSGNHSPSNPLTTLLHAARELRDDPRVCFYFVGGGLGKQEVEQFAREHRLGNVVSLPYQLLSELRYSLSAADVHVVSLGERMAGTIHPCKVYGALACGRPVLYLGPRPSHITDILDEHSVGWHIAHGDTAAAVRLIKTLAAEEPAELQSAGDRGRSVVQNHFSQAALCSFLCHRLEAALGMVSAEESRRVLPVGTRAAVENIEVGRAPDRSRTASTREPVRQLPG